MAKSLRSAPAWKSLLDNMARVDNKAAVADEVTKLVGVKEISNEEAARIFGDASQADWLRTIADRWFRIARGSKTSAAEHRLSPLRRPDQRGAPHNEPRATVLLGAGMNVYERRLPLDDIAGCPLGDLLAYWERRRGKGGARLALPARRDLNLRSIKSLLGRINIVAVHREQPAMRFVWCLHGTESVLVHGVDRTGKDNPQCCASAKAASSAMVVPFATWRLMCS